MLSQRAAERLSALRVSRPWVRPGATTVVTEAGGRARWWTHAGWRANLALGFAASPVRTTVAGIGDFYVAVDPETSVSALQEAVGGLGDGAPEIAPWITAEPSKGSSSWSVYRPIWRGQ